jgi:hypothetical protein
MMTTIHNKLTPIIVANKFSLKAKSLLNTYANFVLMQSDTLAPPYNTLYKRFGCNLRAYRLFAPTKCTRARSSADPLVVIL